ncbi:MAG: hypothetical protein ACOYT4_05435 [Nanoarchaeota archaeon]
MDLKALTQDWNQLYQTYASLSSQSKIDSIFYDKSNDLISVLGLELELLKENSKNKVLLEKYFRYFNLLKDYFEQIEKDSEFRRIEFSKSKSYSFNLRDSIETRRANIKMEKAGITSPSAFYIYQRLRQLRKKGAKAKL